MIIEKEVLSSLIKTYLPHANEMTVDRIVNKVEYNADKALLTVVWEAIEEEGLKVQKH